MRFKDGIKEKNIIIKCGSDKILPFAITFGIYVILFGTISPGGGFQGGVIVSATVVLLYLAYGYDVTRKAISPNVLKVSESVGAILFVCLGLLGVFFAANFCRNVLYNDGQVGDMISAGTVTFMTYAVGYKVLTGVGFLLMIMLGFMVRDDKREKALEEGKEGAE
jgi:multisubunit Na+/H+ antiporter MnhB subunit